jgi:hypothetical protein
MSNGYLFGAGALVIFWIFSFAVTGQFNPIVLAYSENPTKPGEKRNLSASKFQSLIWTIVTLFAYASIFGARLLSMDAGEPVTSVELPNIPVKLLILMGLSVATAAGSKGVTISYKSQGLIDKKGGGLVTNPNNDADLIKIQMLVWTIIAAGIYMITVVDSIAKEAFELPDVEGALLVLMGASQGAYIGNKLVSKDVTKTPRLFSISAGIDGTSLTLDGENFGGEQGASFVRINETDITTSEITSWSDFRIQLKIPATINADQTLIVKVNRDGEWSGEKKLFDLPNLVEKTYKEALILTSGRFKLKINYAEEIPKDTEDYWIIVNQDPAYRLYRKQPKDAVITVDIESRLIEVPNLIGMTLAEAQMIVDDQFILLPIPEEANSDQKITDQQPDHSAKQPVKSPITISLE